MPVAFDTPPTPGELVRVRQRRYLVEAVQPAPRPEDQTLVRLSCLEDDAEGEELEVLWERELDAQRFNAADWTKLAQGNFDEPRYFGAYYHTLRWNAVTSTDPQLFQAPYRAGIRVDAYQLEPLRKALLLPRVNLFIADDVGLGKTIEAGLIVRELLMRQRVRRIVVAAPPSVVLQWKEELDQRFGLTFVVFDRDYVRRMRQERGFAVNPWATHSRFIVSHHLLRDEDYASPLRDWLGDEVAGSLLILDEAHNAAPASGAKYAIDSQFTRSIRELAPRFEHRLFLSATPHNGHSNSFSALLEILDPQRFCRGVPVDTAKQLEPVMVRRLKEDLRRLEGGFPERKVVEVVIDGLPPDAPELELPKLLDDYKAAREERLKDAPKSVQNASSLVLCSLQKRLLSSIEAFAMTLKVHRKAFEAVAAKAVAAPAVALAPARLSTPALRELLESPDADDERAETSEDEVSEQEAAAIEAATAGTMLGTGADPFAAERALLARMTEVAESARGLSDARVKYLVDWIRAHPDDRVLVFTEYADTKRYLERRLRAQLTPGREGDSRIATFHGGMPDDAREEVKRAFNSDPAKHPLRVLIATDAAREGVNLQNHCADLFHFDVPWNPSRLEQRNGRIDRKLQRALEVRCHYFFYAQRDEDRVLKALVQKTKVIRQQLGSLAPVLERRLEDRLAGGFSRRDVAKLAKAIEDDQLDAPRETAAREELEATRVRDQELAGEIAALQGLLKKSRDWLKLDEDDLRQAISCGLELMGEPGLAPGTTAGAFALPALSDRFKGDASWMHTLDTLRAPRGRNQDLNAWRREKAIRPVVFKDQGTLDAQAVHLHLEHRFVQRLLGRFRSQGFVHTDLQRVCVVLTDDPVARVMLLGRLSLYGDRAARLHDHIMAVAAPWLDAEARKEPLAMDDQATTEALDLLERALKSGDGAPASPQVRARLATSAAKDLEELRKHLEQRQARLAKDAIATLRKRGDKEAAEMRAILESQKKRILDTQKRKEKEATQLALFAADELKQLEADKRYWHRRLDSLEQELTTEPERIRKGYEVRATRFEPVGLVYLWPVTG
ncbi:MAG: helicase [Acidobacteria bacterium]|nr:helicase [Acidobacteriota bacterium]